MTVEAIPGEVRHPALALANTVLRRHGGDVDLIAEPGEAGRWLVDHLGGSAGYAASVDGAGLAAVGELREAVRELFRARVVGERPAGEAVSVVNRVAGVAPSVPMLRWAGGDRLVRESVMVAGTGFERALAALAGDAIELATGDEALVACGAPDCVRFLVRNHGKRQWCSTRCGDRVRAARHYARTRPN